MRDYAVALPQCALTGAWMTARPTAANEGVDLKSGTTAWPALFPLAATVFLTAAGAVTLNAVGGANSPEVWGYRVDHGKWYLLGVLNKGVAISILAASEGYAEQIQFPGVFDRLAIVGAGAGAAAAIEPMETHS